MTHQPNPQDFTPAQRRDGWSPERKVRFLDGLASHGHVRAAAAAVGISAQSAYVERRRDAVFAAAWDAAMVLATDHAEQLLAHFALEGIEEEVWHRGQMVGTRVRFDTRLLLAHLARLDRRGEDELAQRRAGRFDEMLGLVAGEAVPREMADDGGLERETDAILPADREEHAMRARSDVYVRNDDRWGCDERGNADEADEIDDRSDEEIEAELAGKAWQAMLDAEQQWDAWHARALGRVDAIRAQADPARQDWLKAASTSSTSAENGGCGPGPGRNGAQPAGPDQR